MLNIQVPSTVVIDSKIAIVGESPGKDEVAQRQGFVGKAGQTLNMMLSAAGIERRECSIYNVVKRAPEGGYDSEHFKQTFYETKIEPKLTKGGKPSKKVVKITRPTAELEAWYDLLQSELEVLHPNVVIATGGEALKFLCGVEGITNYRGSLMESTRIPGLKVVPIVHPSWITKQAQWEYYYISMVDIKKALRESKLPVLERIKYRSVIPHEVDVAVGNLGYLADSGQDYSLDLEIRAGSIACIGLAYARPELTGFCIPTQTTKGPYWTPNDESLILTALDKLFRVNPNLIGQNIWSFDLYWLLRRYGMYPAGVKMDTMIGQFLLAPELPKGLDFIASIHTDAVFWKPEGKTWGKGAKVSDEQLWAYNIKDCIYTFIAADEITKELKKQNKLKLYNEYANKLGPYCLEMMYRGLPVDYDKFKYAQKIVEDERIEVRKKVVETIGPVNVYSPKDMQGFVFSEMELPARYNRKTKRLTTDEDALMELLLTYPEKAEPLRLIMKERHLRKQVSNYVNEKILSPDGFLRYTVTGPGTKTFRMSMSESPFGEGCNAQTLPKTLRFPYMAPPGRVFLAPDQKQAEARIVAYDAECIRQIEKFQNPKWSIHNELGEKVFHETPIKDSPQYIASKAGIHGGNFRMGALKLAKTTGVPVKTCKLAMEGYHALYPEIRKWHESQKQLVLSKHSLTNPFGFSRIFYRALAAVVLTGALPTDEWNDICSWLSQSCPPFIANLGFMGLIDKLDYIWLHHQNHDSYLASVPIEKAQESAEVALECLKIPMTIKGRTVTIPNDMQIGYSFGLMMPYQGSNVSVHEWESFSESERKLGKGDSRENIIRGVYGIL